MQNKIQNFPWHESIWSKLTTNIENIPHGLLFSGQPGIGKLVLAQRFANLLLCDTPLSTDTGIQQACGHCKSCKLNSAGTHPDYIKITPEESKKVIAVDQTRELSRQLQLKSHIAKRKVAIIHPAETMNKNSANSLLKILEEPPQNNVLILVSNKYSLLSMTIKSRCIKFSIPLPDKKIAINWLKDQQPQQSNSPADLQSLLKFSGGAPLLANDLLKKGFSETRLQLLDDIQGIANRSLNLSTCAKKWKELGSDLCLMWFQRFLSDMARALMTETANKNDSNRSLANKELTTGLQLPKKALNLRQLFEFIDVVSGSKKLLEAPMDEQLLLEDILIRWQGLMKA